MFDVIIPSSKKKIKIRPMLVKEEKILLMAKTGEDANEILTAVKQVVNNCIVDADVDVEKLTLFDIEYLFVKIRSFSVSSISKVSYRDNEDNKVYDFDVDLEKVEVRFPEKVEKNFPINENTGILMKYPDASLYSNKEFLESKPENILDQLIINCIDKIYVDDEMIDPKKYPKNELEEFVQNLDVTTYEKLRGFFSNLPSLYYKITYKNENGNERNIEMTSLTDFFTLR